MEEPLFVRQHDVHLHWHEAVALVLSVTDALQYGRIRSVPTPGELALEIDGSLHLTSRAGTVRADGTTATSDLRELLQELLPPDAPQALRALAEGADGSTAVGTLSDFREALAFFERPTSKEDLRALAARLGQAEEEERHVESEIERLSRRARAEAPDPAGTRGAAAHPTRKFSRKALLGIVGLTAAAAAAAAVVGIFFAPVPVGSGSSEGSSAQTGAREKGIIEKLSAAASSAFGKSTAPPPPPAAPAPEPAPPIQRQKSAPPPAVATPPPPSQPLPQLSADAADVRPLELLPLPTLVPSWSPPETKLPGDATLIYDHRNLDVVAPALLRPHLPKVGVAVIGGAPPGAVEVVVGPDGRVEQVRLVRTSVERHYYDAMIVAAIKAWVFRPATRSGQPVRYRLQITLT